jgi:flagellar FliL protein
MLLRHISYRLLTVFFSFTLVLTAPVYAETTSTLPVYLTLKPDFIVNYSASGPRLKYIKTSITLRTADAIQSQLIESNMPLVRDAIVMFMSELKAEQVTGAIAREQSRKDILAALNATLKAETGQEPVMDLLFSSFVTQ